MHVPPQSTRDPRQVTTQLPALHALPGAHTLPHDPQFALSLDALAQ
jgi:hypothetical protein